MKREIKFRGWHKHQKRFINLNGCEIAFHGCSNVGRVYNITEQGVMQMYPIDDIELIQYTGLKDKNGVEIYEGDIVRCSDGRIAKIIWFEFGWHIESNPFSKMEKSYAKMDKDEGDSVILMEARRYGHLRKTEVIGNIYENPELL